MSKSFGVSIDLNQVDRLESIFKDKRKMLCVNDDIDFKEEYMVIHFKNLKEHYPENQLLKMRIRDGCCLKEEFLHDNNVKMQY